MAENIATEQAKSPGNKNADRRIIIRTVGLKKSYMMKDVLTQALRGVDIAIYQGEFISVMGPSGSGKSRPWWGSTSTGRSPAAATIARTSSG